jgi:hypothetical protein
VEAKIPGFTPVLSSHIAISFLRCAPLATVAQRVQVIARAFVQPQVAAMRRGRSRNRFSESWSFQSGQEYCKQSRS